MNIRCPDCQTVFRVDPARVPAAGVRARCARCSATFTVRREEGLAAPAAPAAAPPPEQVPLAAAAPTGGPAQQEAAAAADQDSDDAAQRSDAAAQDSDAAPKDRAAAGSQDAPTPANAGVAASPPYKPAYAAQPGGTAGAGTPPAATASAPAGGGSEAAPAAGTAVAPRMPVFGSKDPDSRAKRIARALVSDIAAYHPARREESLKAGTLRADFREEIMKSWEEYVAQVGLELAKSTPHFRNALNDVLARGQTVF